jgi:cytochrome P450
MPDIDSMWKHHRRVVGPSMHQRYLSRMESHIFDTANMLVKLWNSKLDLAKNRAFNVEVDLRLATMVGSRVYYARLV